MSQLKKISTLALAIGIALTGACSSKPVETEITTNSNFYDTPLQENYFSYYYDYDMGKSVATGSYDKPANVTNVHGIKNIKYKFSLDENNTYLDLVINYKTTEVDGSPYYVSTVNDTDGKVLTMNEKNRKIETCRTPGTIAESLGTASPGCWITEKVQVVYPSFPLDAPISVVVNFRNHDSVGIDLSRKYVNELQELATKLKKKRLEVTQLERDDGLARLNLIEPTPIAIIKPAPEQAPIIYTQPPVLKPVSSPVYVPVKTATVSKPVVKKAPVHKPAPKKQVKKYVPKKVAADCPPESVTAVGSFKKTVIKQPVTNKNVDVYIDNAKDGNKATVVKQPVKIVTPQVVSPK